MMITTRRILLLLTLFLLLVACGGHSAHAHRQGPVAVVAPVPSPIPLPAVPYEKLLPIPNDLILTERGRNAIQVLGHAPAFGGHAVGYGGDPLPEVVALRALLAEAHSTEALVVVLDHGTLPAQLMALSGLYFADPILFRKRIDAYEKITTMVPRAQEGCDGNPPPSQPANVIVRTPGAIQYQGPHDTLAGYIERNRIPLPSTSPPDDIAGGGWPHTLYGRK
jgi:hypothetical protein